MAFEDVLGPRASWPVWLTCLVGVIAESKVPQHLMWGEDLRLLYNAACVPVLGRRHPAAQGQPVFAVWPELAEELEPLVEQIRDGKALAFEDRPFMVRRNGVDELAWFSFAWTPVRDEVGLVVAVHCILQESTPRILAERESRRLSVRLRDLFEQAPGFMAFLSGPQHVFELANAAYLQLVGRDDVVGRPVADALPEVVAQGFVELLDTVYRSAEPYVGRRVPVDLVPAAGGAAKTRYVDFIFQPVLDDAGRATGVFVQGSDVTDQILAEELLRERTEEAVAAARDAELERRRLESLLRATPVGIIYADAQGRLLLGNDAVERVWGTYPRTDSVADYALWRGWWADNGPRHGSPVAPQEWPLARALVGEDCEGIVEIERFDGPERRVVLICAAPVRTSDGEVAATQDLTERVNAERELRRSEAQFRAITDAMPQMVWSTLPDGYHDFYNHRWYEFTGVPPGSSDGEGWAGVFHPDDQPRAWDRWRHSLATGEPYEVEYRLRHHSGEYRWVLGRALPVRDDAGAIIRWMGTCTDIDDIRGLQAELQHSRAALAAVNERKDAFLAMLAHELRNPIAPISAASHVLMMAAHDPGRVRQAAEIISRQVQLMTTLVQDLTDVARITQGLIEYQRESLDLRDVIGAALEQVAPCVARKQHRLQCRVGDMPLRVEGDHPRLVQVFANLVGNACKYTPAAGDIEVVAEQAGDEIVIRIRDSGVGMSADLLPHVFELFTQAERDPERTEGGLGIGLAVVARIIDAHGGRVSAVSSGPGLGSTFSVHLPRTA